MNEWLLDILSSFAASALWALVGFLGYSAYGVARRRRRVSGLLLDGTWCCKWQTASQGLPPIEKDTLIIKRTIWGTYSFKTEHGELPWSATSEVTANKHHMVLQWEVPHKSGVEVRGVSTLYIATDASYMVGHWYGESADGTQTFGWSILYKVRSDDANQRAFESAERWLSRRPPIQRAQHANDAIRRKAQSDNADN
jgi:hypothetical protein